MLLYVGNLSFEVGQEDLRLTDRETGFLRGFGFVEMGTEAEEDTAMHALDGAT